MTTFFIGIKKWYLGYSGPQFYEDTMSFYAKWDVAPPGHPIYLAEHTLTQEPQKLTVSKYPMNKKIPLNGEFSWRIAGGRITEFVVKHFPFFWPFQSQVETTIRPESELLANHDFEQEEYVPLLRQEKKAVSPFSFTKEQDGSCFFIDGHSRLRSRAIPENVLIRSLCDGPKPHIGLASYRLQGISAEGIPNLLVALKQKGDFRAGLHNSFLIKPFARLLGLEDRDMLVAVGEVKEAGVFSDSKLEVPEQQLFTARRVDTAIKAFFGLGLFGAVCSAYKSTPGAFSLSVAGCSFLVMLEAYASFSR